MQQGISDLFPGRQHIPDRTDFPYSFIINYNKTAPHFSCSAVSILYFIPAVHDGAGSVYHPYFINRKRPGARAVGEIGRAHV